MHHIDMPTPCDLNETALKYAAELIGTNCDVRELEIVCHEANRKTAERLREIYGCPFVMADTGTRSAWSAAARGAIVHSNMID